MGKQRAIIFLGTTIASLALVLGMIAVLPTTTDLQATSSDINLNGHFSFTIADPDGTIVHYAQMDNFATDLMKTNIINGITGFAAMPSSFWIALCSGADAANDFALAQCSTEFSAATGRCDGNAGGGGVGTAVVTPTSVNGGATGTASATMTCETTIGVADGNVLLTNLSINELGVSGVADATAISAVSTPVTVFGNQIVTSTFTVNANN